MADPLPFLGRGWKFPPAFSGPDASVDMVAGVTDIEESLRILLATAQGERVMLPTYGCNLHRFVFRDLTTGLITEIRDMVSTAILRWEPRIDLLSVTVAEDTQTIGLIRIGIDYRVRRTNVRTNMVFPFYLTEATLAPGR